MSALAPNQAQTDNVSTLRREDRIAMNRYISRFILAALCVASAAPLAHAKNMCIDTRDILSSKSSDGRTMIFKMKNGKTLINHLRGVCPDLKYEGFIWQLPTGSTQACENEIGFTVLHSGGESCILGKFEPS